MTRARGNPQTSLRPQDLLVLLRLSLVEDAAPGYAELAADLGLTASEVHAAVARAVLAKLAPVADLIVEAELARTKITDAGLAALAACANLRTIAEPMPPEPPTTRQSAVILLSPRQR